MATTANQMRNIVDSAFQKAEKKKRLDPVEQAAETIRSRKQRAIDEERKRLAAAERHTDWNFQPTDDPRLNEPEPGEDKAPAKSSEQEFAVGEIDEDRIVMQIRIDDIQPSPHNPRQTFDEEALAELARSIREYGLIQPITVLPAIGGKHEIAYGERRYRAAKIAGLKTIPCVVQDAFAGDSLAIDLARMKENEDRADLNPIDEALAFERFTKAKTDGGHGLSQTELAKRLNCTQGHISNRLRLLRLPVECRPLIISGELTIEDARHLVPVADMPHVVQKAIKERNSASWMTMPRAITIALGELFMRVQDYDGFPPALLKKFGDRLEVISYKPDGETARRYIKNKDVAQQILSELQAEEIEKAAQQRAAGKTGAMPVDPRRAKELAEQAAKTYAKRICRYLSHWYQTRLLERLPTLPDHVAAAWFIWFGTIRDGASSRAGEVNDLFGIKHQSGDLISDDANRLVGLAKHPALNAKTAPPGALNKTVIDLLKAWLSVSTEGWQTPIPPVVLWTLAKQAGVDLAKEWRIDAEFLGLHTLAQLHELNAELKIGIKGWEDSKKSEYLDLMLTAAGAKKLPLPECLKNAEPVRLV